MKGRTPFLIAALTTPLLALGAVTSLTLAISAAVVILAAVAVAAGDLRRSPSGAARLAAVALWGQAFFCAAQLVPLPLRLLRVLSPEAAGLWARASATVGDPTAFRPLTLDPPGTWFALATCLVACIFFEAASRYAADAPGRVRLSRAVIVAVLVAAGFAVLHAVAGLDRLYGFYEPHSGWTQLPIRPSLLNPNHAAAAFGVAPPLLIALTLEAESGAKQIVALTGAVVTSAVAALTLSRSGVAVVVAETAVLTVYAMSRRRQSNRAPRSWSGATVVALAGFATLFIVSWVAFEPLLRELGSRDFSKLRILPRAAQLVSDYPLFGVGRGAFASTFPRYEGDLAIQYNLTTPRFTHPESWPLQLAGELGVPAAATFSALLVVAVTRSARSAARRPLGFGALVALCGLVVHDLADFSLEYASVALLAVALLAIVTTTANDGRDEPKPTHPRRLFRGTTMIATGAVGTTLALAASWGTTLDSDIQQLTTMWRAGRLRDGQATIRSAITRHPAEAFFPMLAAIAVSDTAEAGPLFASAITLAPTRAQTHFWFARWLVRTGRTGQAWAEYRESLRFAPAYARTILDDMIGAGAPLADIQAVATTKDALEQATMALVLHKRPADAEQNDRFIVETFPPAVEASLRQIGREMARDPATGRALARRLQAAAPTDPRTHIAVAHTCEPAPECADRVLQDALAQLGDAPELLEALIRLRGPRLGTAALGPEFAKLREALARRQADVARVHALRAEIELARNLPAAALNAYLDAATVSADPTMYLELAASLAEQQGRLRIAMNALDRLRARHPGEPKYRDAALRIAERMAASAAELP